MKQQVHTSALLMRLMKEAPKDTVDLDWLLGHLQHRAFGFLLLTLAIGILVPGLGVISSIAIALPTVEMVLDRDRPMLPRFLTKRSFATERFTKWAKRSLPFLRFVERVISFSGQHLSTGNRGRCPRLPVVSQCGESLPKSAMPSAAFVPSCRARGS